MSETNTPASTSTSVTATGNESLTLADEIKKYNMTELIDFLRKEKDLDWYFIMYMPERIYCTKVNYHIDLTEDILDDDAKLRQGVKEVMGVIVGLLKDRVEVDDTPDSKRIRTKKFIKG
ncbi:hypothetical protein C1645_882660 [Glomus cerebriforme]|uniref:Uncharacterized protein n=1 Tax=Glomus cerebriforme TaxID=658196 RepID=A0A397S646_9GLOM|nr:hypothetical protein C1645_882660 [Glomus cerebriforme]